MALNLLSFIHIIESPAEQVFRTSMTQELIISLNLDHWTLPPLKRTQLPLKILEAQPRRLRIYWMNKGSSVYATSMLPPKKWFIFWSACLAHKVVTPWWRLLINSVGHAERLHRWSPDRFPSPLCSICKASNETLSHLFVECVPKRVLWEEILTDAQLDTDLFESDRLWRALSTLTLEEDKPLSAHIFTVLGNGISAIWHYHWQCFFEDKTWISTEAYNVYLSKSRHFRG